MPKTDTESREKAMGRLGAKMPKLATLAHPMQPIGFDEDNVIRFKQNAIVDFLMDACACGYKFDLNDLAVQMQNGGARFPDGPLVSDGFLPGAPPFIAKKKPFRVPEKPFSQEDYTQLMQLIGYSVSGAGDLSSFDKKTIARADAESERIWAAADAE